MGISLESAMNAATAQSGVIAGRSLDEWNEAYAVVERYLESLLVRNRLLRGQLVGQVLDRAMQRAENEREQSTVALACEELDRLVTEWFAAVLDEPVASGNTLLSNRGRLALLLADMPGKWQDQFLRPPPWPEEFVRAMRESFLKAGPDFHFSQMNPRPIDLGAITTLTNLGNVPYFRMVVVWLGFALLLVIVFRMTH
jgi:hypothetical protein